MTVPRPRRSSGRGGISSVLLSRLMPWTLVVIMAMCLVYQNQSSLLLVEPCLATVRERHSDDDRQPATTDNPSIRGVKHESLLDATDTMENGDLTTEASNGSGAGDTSIDATKESTATEPVHHAETDRVTKEDKAEAANSEPTEIDLIPPQDLNPGFKFNDVFAASWWQTMSRFMDFDAEECYIVEDDAFKPILKAGNGFDDVRMALDWLDFSLEHLSKWWKMGDAPAMMYGIGKLQSYIQRTVQKTPSTAMSSTLAIIPYGVNVRGGSTEEQIWATSLAATIASLLQFGVGRVLVVGYYDADHRCTKSAFAQLMRYRPQQDATDTSTIRRRLSSSTISASNSTKPEHLPFSTYFGSTELAFVHTNEVKSKFIEENIPKGALKGLQEAINGTKPSADWLGETPSKFKYLFLTEADQILSGRLTSFFTRELDKGRIVIPHRLQPIPHPLDLGGIVNDAANLLLPADKFPDVYELDAATDSCCDTGEHVDMERVKGCGAFWWQCGFHGRGDFSHLEEYSLMRLTEGTGIVSLSATEHSRRCIPRRNERTCRKG